MHPLPIGESQVGQAVPDGGVAGPQGDEPCHCFGVLGEAVQTTSNHTIATARRKADASSGTSSAILNGKQGHLRKLRATDVDMNHPVSSIVPVLQLPRVG